MNEIIAVVVTPEHRHAIENYLMTLLENTELRLSHSVVNYQFKLQHPEGVDVCLFSTNDPNGFRGLEFSNVLMDAYNREEDLELGYLHQLRLKEKDFHYFYNPKEAYEIITKIFKSRGWMK